MSEYVFKLPDLGEGTVESEIGEWFIKVGDDVAEEDVVGTMMTDKAAVELSSPVSGKVLRLAGEPGDIVAVGAALVVFETDAVSAADDADTSTDAAARAAAARAAETPAAPPTEAATKTTQASAGNGRIVTSPAIRRRAKEAGIDLATIAGSGPGGRITRADFDAQVDATPADGGTRRQAASGQPEEIRIIGVRRMIAERMTAAKREIPHFSYVEEVDVTALEALRRHLNAGISDRERQLTLLPFLGTAIVRAVGRFPQCNATYDKDRNLLLRYPAVHLGIATQTADGLKVPVVRHAEAAGLHELAAGIRTVTGAARDNRARREDLSGSTITITSLGKLGGIASTPVINAPEVAIVGVNRAVPRPVVVDGQVTVRTMMNLSSSFDHRFVDGYDAAAFIQDIKSMLEHPASLFIDSQ